MASTNQSPEYQSAEKRYLSAKNDEERILALEEMMKTAPKHKSSDSMRANIRTRYIKLREKIETSKKKKKGSGKEGIKKEEMQAVLIGLTNSGKSSILASLTNAKPLIAQYPYTTTYHSVGTMEYSGVQVQIVDLPAVESEYFDQGIANTADTLIITITRPQELEKIFPFLEKTLGKKIIILNKIDLLSESEIRRLSSFLLSKKYQFILFSSKTKENLEELKKKIWESFDRIRIYTKQPGQPADKSPVVMEKASTVYELAEKIFHGFAKKIKETLLTGPSSKFANQKVGLEHVLKDKDIVEFRMK